MSAIIHSKEDIANGENVEDPEEKLHKRHAQEKLKRLFESRRTLFKNRIKPIDSSEDEDNTTVDERYENRLTAHASTTIKKISVKEEIFRTKSTALTWTVVPEIVFILLSFFDVIFSTYLITMGLTGISWKSSIDSIVVESIDHSTHEHDDKFLTPINFKLFGMGKDYNMVNFNIRALGIILVSGGLTHVINSIVGTQVAFRGMKNALRGHCAVAFLLLLVEVVTGGIVYTFGSCDATTFEDKFKEHFFNIYTIGTESKLKIDSVQRSLGCCGLDHFTDYLVYVENMTKTAHAHHKQRENPNVEEEDFDDLRKDVADDVIIFQQTCCNNWWIHNIQCASKIHEFTVLSDAKTRLSETGCQKEVKDVCERIVHLMGRGVLIAALGHLCMFVITVFCIHFQISIINSMAAQCGMKARQAEDLCMGIYDDESEAGSLSPHNSPRKNASVYQKQSEFN